MKHRVTVVTSDRSSQRVLQAEEGVPLHEVLRENGLGLPALCNGRGLCGKCLVEVKGQGRKLACRTVVRSDCEIILPRQREAAVLLESSPDLKPLPEGGESAGKGGGRFGVAVDIGTTTVAVYLHDLGAGALVEAASLLNPQQEYGADVISRIHYTMEHPAGLEILRNKIHAGINRTLTAFFKERAIRKEDIIRVAIVGNTTMLHLFAGVNPSSIALAPFLPVFTDQKRLPGAESGLLIHPEGAVFLLPSLSGYIGSDITAGIAATPMADRDAFSLLIDIGTNGEMALGNKDIIYCCSTAAGPAFEGARIQCGMAGVEGAIARYAGGSYETIGGAGAAGICGSGLIDIMAFLLDRGLISPEGFMEKDFLVEGAEKNEAGHDIVITPRDIREVQLGKAAVAAGLKILLKESGLSPDRVETVYLAGGFGSHIDPASAASIGLIPSELKDRVKAVGNSAGHGAQLFLRSAAFEGEVKKVIEKARYIELSSREDFNEEFVNEMAFPSTY